MPGVEPPQPIGPVSGPENIPTSESVSSVRTTSQDQISSMEESKLLAALLMPLVSSFPVLKPPSENAGTVDSLSSILSSLYERKKMVFLFEMMSQMGKEIDDINQAFEDNLQAIEEETKRIMNSAAYLVDEEIKRKGHHSGKVIGSKAASGIEDEIKRSEEEGSISKDYIDRFNEKVKAQADLKIPFTVLFTVAGSLALGEMVTRNEAVQDLVLLVENIQHAVPKIKPEEMQPVINLMVMAMIIFRPLDESIGNQKENEQQNFVKKVENFAKDVIKMVSDPTFALLTVVNNIEKTHQLSPKEKNRLVASLKLILASVALSLLYSLEVGKIQGGKFFGMEPMEFKALLDPRKPLLEPKPIQKMTEIENLMWSLIQIIREQLAELPQETIESTFNSVLDYLDKKQNVGKLLDPSKVLVQVFHSMKYKTPYPNPLYV